MREPPVETLPDLLAWRARDTPDRPAFTFGGTTWTYGAVWTAATECGALLLRQGLAPGEPVVLALPNGPEFFAGFYGIQRAGGVAVPIFPAAGPERSLRLAAVCGARLIVVPSSTPAAELAPWAATAAAQGRVVLALAQQPPAAGSTPPFPPVGPDQLAYLQYTSGSTGDPKGVQLSAAQLLTNVRQMIAGMDLTPSEVFVSWLPVYHDMGLILKTLVPFYLAAELHLLPTNLREVHPWLDALQRRRATFTAAPDYAYRLCVRHARTPGAYDLTSLRVALNAAEPVRAATLRDFERAFGLKNVMVAGYGLAEAAVGVAMWPPGRPARVDERGLVSVGRPFPEITVQIVAGDAPVPAGQTGEIVVCSPANTTGYFNNPAATAKLFWRPGWVRTGDLGYVDDAGHLFIAGRLKNILKRAGQTMYAQEVEEVVDRWPGVRYSAAVGIDRGGVEGEQVYVFAEVREGEALPNEARHALAVDLAAQLYTQLGFRPARVYLLRPRAVPLTHNGKLRHAELKASYLTGALRRAGAILYPEF